MMHFLNMGKCTHIVLLFCAILLFLILLFPPRIQAAGYGPSSIKAAYNLPSSGGNGTVAIVLWGMNPTLESDLNKFSSQFGLPECTVSKGCLSIHYMGQIVDQGTSVESDMDTQWVHAIAPNAKLLFVVANSNSNNNGDIPDAISYASLQPGVVAVNMSFGVDNADGKLPCNVFSNPNIAYFASSGDHGHGVGWPDVCPQVIAVGGTTLNMSGSSVVSETAWSGSGGGLSKIISEPNYQISFNIPQANNFRGVPDVSAVGNGATGAIVVVHGQNQVWGGTSLSSPIWAGIAALSSGQITHDLLYNNGNAQYNTHSGQYYRDITQGTNGNCGYYCTAQTGYDYITGLGSPLGLPTGTGAPLPTTSPPPVTTVTPTFTPTPTPTTPVINPTPQVTKTPSSSSSINVFVYVDNDNSGGFTAGDTAYIGANIYLSGCFVKTLQTDSSGNALFSSVPPGNCVLRIGIPILPNTFGPYPVTLASQQQANFIFGIPRSMFASLTPIPTQTPVPTQSIPGSSPTPTPIPQTTYNCVIDQTNCPQGQKNLQLCPLVCTPN